MPKNLDGKEVTCPKCDYTWLTKSEMDKVTCPNCQHKIPVD